MIKRKNKAPSRKVSGRNKNKESGRKAAKAMKNFLDAIRNGAN